MNLSGRMALLFLLIFTFLGVGCVTSNDQVSNINTQPSNTNQPVAPSTPKSETASAEEGQTSSITLPVLDAFFADEAFTKDLKSEIGLTDEQIENLKKMARSETAKLRETDKADYDGSSADARKSASEKIKEIIGQEKANALSLFISKRWSGESNQETNADNKLNNIPTDTRIVVNAASYRMDVFKDGQLMKSYTIGIGYPEFPLPMGLRKADTIIFNPTWTPPDEPWVEGSKDVKVGEKIAAGSKQNPLGVIKIPIGMPSLIHGGKSPDKLGRFASHGCVGLTDPLVQDFAQLLADITGTNMSSKEVKQYAHNRTVTQDVKLAKTVPVELRYETIVVEDGKLHIYRDVYERGTNSEANLQRVLETYGTSLDQLTEAERTKVLDAIKEMSRDAKNNPVTPTSEPTPANANTDKQKSENTNKANVNANTNSKATTSQITRTIKGRKEIVIEIASLKGKGYPAPIKNVVKKQEVSSLNRPTNLVSAMPYNSALVFEFKGEICQKVS